MKTAMIGFWRQRWAIAPLLLLLAVGAGIGFLRPGKSQTPPQPAAVSAPGTFRPTEEQWKALKVEEVESRSFRPEQVTEGNIALDDDLNTPVFSPYSGRVTRLIAKLGDRVERGAPLFAVDATEFVQAANDLITAVSTQKTAHALLSQAEINEKRAHELYLAKGGALKDWQQSQTDLAAAQNTLRSSEVALAAVRNRLRILGKGDKEIAALEAQQTQKLEPGAVVTAPIAGMVTQRQIGLGQYIPSVTSGASNPLYTIGDLSRVWLIANVREADAGSVRLGQPVEVRVLAYPGRIFKAETAWVAPSIDPNTHRLPVRANVENADGVLKPNMFATFSIITGEVATAPAAKRDCLRGRDGPRLGCGSRSNPGAARNQRGADQRRDGRDPSRAVARRKDRNTRDRLHRSCRRHQLSERVSNRR